jgi:D-lactate dehydrogenase (cytochrome)
MHESENMDEKIKQDVLRHLVEITGKSAVLTDASDVGKYATDWRKRYFGRAMAVVKPATTAEVAAVVSLCAQHRIAIVPQGGNTGMVGGATPDESGAQLVVNLSRMNRIRSIDLVNNAVTAEAGCVLANLQQACKEKGRLFPLSLASEGSCEIGGNLSTNAGGTGVLRYGNTRDLALGLEVVLPSGEVWDGLRGLRKDNTGYDLKQMFIGAEGTLGIITAAVLKLFPYPAGRATAIAAVDSPRAALALLAMLQSRCGERLTGFELFSDFCMRLVARHFPGSRVPLQEASPHYTLVELSDTRSSEQVQSLLEEALGEALEQGVAKDAAVAVSEAQASSFWKLRENISEAQAAEGRNIKHDVSVPISNIAAFIDEGDAQLEKVLPGVRMVTFGHLGDGNLHYNVSPPSGMQPDDFMARAPMLNEVVHDLVARFGGSISAEHGLGQLKREEITRYKSTLELDMMRRIKVALDPQGIMNPGKVL